MSSYVHGTVSQSSLQEFEVEYLPLGVLDIGSGWADENNLTTLNGEASTVFTSDGQINGYMRLQFSAFSRNIPANAQVLELGARWQQRISNSGAGAVAGVRDLRWYRDDVNVTELTRYIATTVGYTTGTTAWQSKEIMQPLSYWGMTNSEFIASWNNSQGCDLEMNSDAPDHGFNIALNVRNIYAKIKYLA